MRGADYFCGGEEMLLCQPYHMKNSWVIGESSFAKLSQASRGSNMIDNDV